MTSAAFQGKCVSVTFSNDSLLQMFKASAKLSYTCTPAELEEKEKQDGLSGIFCLGSLMRLKSFFFQCLVLCNKLMPIPVGVT